MIGVSFKLGWGGAPPWVYKRNEEIMRSSYQSEVSRLEQRISDLEAENSKLKIEIAEFKKKHEDCLAKSNGGHFDIEQQQKSPLAKLEDALLAMIEDFNSNRFRPNSEEDVTACVYHEWLQKYPLDLSLLHLEARICRIQTNKHSDIAFGKTEDNNENRPSVIQPLLVSEVKSFWGLTKAQPKTRRRDLEPDILALAENSLGDSARALIVFDMLPTRENFLEEKYNQRLFDLIRQQGNSISIFIVRFKNGTASLFKNFL